MTDYRSAQLRIDNARGRAAKVLGPPCNIYRVQANAGLNYLDTVNRVATAQRCFTRLNTKKSDIESPMMGTIFFNCILDATLLETGDCVVVTDSFYGTGGQEVDFTTSQFEGYLLAYHSAFKRTIGARVDRTCAIYRPAAVADATNTWTPTVSATTMGPVVLSNGGWSVAAPGSVPSLIPMGLASISRIHSLIFKDLPGGTGETHWFIYLPELNGFQPQEGDRILTDSPLLATASRYVVQHPYSQQAGLQGSQLVCTREIAPG